MTSRGLLPLGITTLLMVVIASACSEKNDGGEGNNSLGGSASGDGGSPGDGDGDNSLGGSASGDGGSAGAAGSINAPAKGPNIAFVTSATFTAAELGGLAGADAKCQAAAQSAELKGKYVAWLSDSSTDAADRIGDARGWERTDGRPFADTLEQLALSELFYPLNMTESGERVEAGPVLTATLPDGTAASGDGSDFCNDFTADSGEGVVVGLTDHGGETWTNRGEFTFAQLACTDAVRLYCFGINATDPLNVDFPPTRVAFVSDESPSNSMGIAHFDSVCAGEAEDAGLSGTFLALLPQIGESAASRFTTTSGLPWGRTDGVPLMDDPSDLESMTLLAPINRLADGSLLEPYGYVTTAAPTPGTAGVAGVEFDESMPGTCNDWSVYYVEYTRGFAHRSDEGWWDYGNQLGCNTWSRVYCLEE